MQPGPQYTSADGAHSSGAHFGHRGAGLGEPWRQHSCCPLLCHHGRKGAKSASRQLMTDHCLHVRRRMPIISALALVWHHRHSVQCIIISLGPIAHVEQNSKTYSAIKPPRCLCLFSMHTLLYSCMCLDFDRSSRGSFTTMLLTMQLMPRCISAGGLVLPLVPQAT